MKIELSKNTVEIKNELTWWDSQEITAIQMSSAKMNGADIKGVDGIAFIQATYKMIEKMVTSVKEGDKEIGFSEEWLKGLSQTDGEKLQKEIEKTIADGGKKN